MSIFFCKFTIMSITTVHIDFYTDFICPWCYIGKARLERLQSKLQDEILLDIAHHPFILYPHIPKGGIDKSVFKKKTKPGLGRSLRQESQLENIEINYKKIERIPSSFEAHRLVHLIQNKEQQFSLAKNIFHGYFEEGCDIENHDKLIDLANTVGISQEIIGQFFTTEMGKAEVKQLINKAKEEFITVVPSIKLDHQFLIPGLQSIEVWENYIRRAATIQNKNKTG